MTAREHIDALFSRDPSLEGCRAAVEAAYGILAESFRAGGKLLVCGNGGSAADGQHIVGELMKSFALPRALGEEWRGAFAGADDPDRLLHGLQRALPAVSLAGETALATAVGNDNGAELVFAQQIFGLGRKGDVLLAISTSGDSANVLRAAETARAVGMRVIGLTGAGGGRLAAKCDVCVAVPETETYRAQEKHLPVYHALCLALEAEFFSA